MELIEHRLSPFDDKRGKAGEFSDMDAVRFVGAAADDFSEENDPFIRFVDGNIVVDSARNRFFKVGELKIVGGKKGFRA